MDQYFTEALPSRRDYVLTFEQLAEAYRTATCGPQLDGLLHFAAKKVADSHPSPYIHEATCFLLQIASVVNQVEPDKSRRDLALALFLQRVLRKVHAHLLDCRELILRFFATEPRLKARLTSGENIRRFLTNEWHPMNRNEWERVEPHLLTDATIGVGKYYLLIRDRAPLEAICKLYDVIISQIESGSVKLECQFWPDLSDTCDLGSIRRKLLSDRVLHDQFTQDSQNISAVCGMVLANEDYSKKMGGAAQALVALLSILQAKIYQRIL
jgi:hypothetical protein